MTDKIIDLKAAREAARDRHTEAEIDADEAQWISVRNQLIEVMAASKLFNTQLTSATINALFEVIQDGDETKRLITVTLRCYD